MTWHLWCIRFQCICLLFLIFRTTTLFSKFKKKIIDLPQKLKFSITRIGPRLRMKIKNIKNY